MSREIDEAQKTIQEAKEKYEEYAKKLEGIEAEIMGLKDSIKKQGETERDEIVKQANDLESPFQRQSAYWLPQGQ